MSPKNSHGFQNVSIFLQNLFKSFRISGTRISATHHTCTNSMQLTHFNLGMSQPTKAENLALKSQIWTHPKMPLFGPFFGPFSHFSVPKNWQRTSRSTRVPTKLIGTGLGRNMDVSKKFPWIPKCLHFFTKSFQVISNLGNPDFCNASYLY